MYVSPYSIWCAHASCSPFFRNTVNSACGWDDEQKITKLFHWQWVVFVVWCAHTHQTPRSRFRNEKFLILFFFFLLPIFHVLLFQSYCFMYFGCGDAVAATVPSLNDCISKYDYIDFVLYSRQTANSGCRHYPHRFCGTFRRLCKYITCVITAVALPYYQHQLLNATTKLITSTWIV